MKLFIILFSALLFADTSSITKVPSGGKPPDTSPVPCIESGIKGEEKCVVPTLNANPLEEPKFTLPKKKERAKKTRETPYKKKN